jgi:hypothetical protein
MVVKKRGRDVENWAAAATKRVKTRGGEKQ